MIRQHFGLTRDPFIIDHDAPLLAHQQRHFDILKVHSQQGGFCLILGEPGTGKTVLKHHIIHHDTKHWITPVINRSLHSWHNILRLLCQAFDLESDGSDHKCEARLIAEARALHIKGKHIIPIIDDAHLIPIEALRKLRLLLEDFPRSHNLILIGQPALNTTLQLRINHDLKTRVTYSAKLDALTANHLAEFIHSQLDRVGLPHATFTEEAVHLITRSAEGTLRAVKNLCIGSLIEAVRDRTKTVDLKQVNAVLLQPHWRHNLTGEPAEPVLIPPANLPTQS
ncbi:ExeA family protein [Haloferula sp. A504]|uniref:ExeA family protein n=1 Tax=Haloferula sp. A504 TaxID=3373601 RepID=UPI0031C1013F|nr:AAA family ATPase [Verrucomicrobiaceae bacterium E54]